MIEESAEPFASGDPACLSFWNALDQPIAQSLVRPLVVVVLDVLRDRSPQMALPMPNTVEIMNRTCDGVRFRYRIPRPQASPKPTS